MHSPQWPTADLTLIDLLVIGMVLIALAIFAAQGCRKARRLERHPCPHQSPLPPYPRHLRGY